MSDIAIVKWNVVTDRINRELEHSFSQTKEIWAANILNACDLFVPDLFVPSAPHIWIPKLSLPAAIGLGAAAAVIRNPIVNRRFWSGWNTI